MGATTLVPATEALELLGWPPAKMDSLYRRVRKGEIPHVRIGRSVFFNPDVLREWIASVAKIGA